MNTTTRVRVTLATTLLMLCGAASATCNVLTEFGSAPGDIRWRTVNDNVMGGRSKGDHRIQGGLMVFRGSTNTNGGGFSSVRSITRPLELAGAGLRLRLKGDGRTYTLRVSSVVQRATWWAPFPTQGEWETVVVPFSAFTPRWRGVPQEGPRLVPELVDGIGLMIYDDLNGAFALKIDSISNCRTLTEPASTPPGEEPAVSS